MIKRGLSLLAVSLGMLLGLSMSASAQTADGQALPVTGEVTKLDKETGRITLRHGEIKSLDMPPMTMVFRVREPKLLDGVAVGDRIRFAAERIDGAYTVTAISKPK
jgi:Cu(I)/Ag(I) efflux system periplasmic protein CusF